MCIRSYPPSSTMKQEDIFFETIWPVMVSGKEGFVHFLHHFVVAIHWNSALSYVDHWPEQVCSNFYVASGWKTSLKGPLQGLVRFVSECFCWCMYAYNLDSRTQSGLRDTSCQATVWVCYLCRGGCWILVYAVCGFSVVRSEWRDTRVSFPF